MDSVIRPRNGLLLIGIQSAEGSYVTLDPTLHAVPVDFDSVKWNSPYRSDDSNETTGSFAAAAPMIIGQPATLSFRSRIKGAGAGVTYTSSVKPPLHAALSGSGLLGVFQAAIAAAALSAGSTTTGTLGTGFTGTPQLYRGMPLVLANSPAVGRVPLITDYTSGKVATLADTIVGGLTASNTAAIPANWTYAPTSPSSSAERATMHPCVTIGWYEDGVLWQWGDCRGVVDMDGNVSAAGFASFNLTGVFISKTDASVPTNAVLASQSAPILNMGSGTQPAMQVNRLKLPISQWSVKNGGQIDSPDDPNTPAGFGPGQISDRMVMLTIDPLSTLVATRNVLAEIAAFSQYPSAIQYGSVAGNRWGLVMPLIQPQNVDPSSTRGRERSESQDYRALNPGRDAAGRDGDFILSFS